jgi:hypothetical protein
MTSIGKESKEIRELGQLVTAIEAANTYFLTQVQKQVNTALTLRFSTFWNFADTVRKN